MLLISAAAVAAGAAAVPVFVDTGPLSLRMLQHLAVMNVVAPLLACWPRHGPAARSDASMLWAAGILQMAMLWAWHLPAFQSVVAGSLALEAAMTLSMLAVSICFWRQVVAASAEGRWRGVGALLLTGKLACVLGALLVFASRDLYAGVAFPWCGAGGSTVTDQKLAGLLMITACPLSYLVAGTAMAARLLRDLDERPDADALAAAR
jgi:putative membrane protein